MARLRTGTMTLDEMRREAAARFPDAPSVCAFGGSTKRRLYAWMTGKELAAALESGMLPAASDIAACKPRTGAAVTAPTVTTTTTTAAVHNGENSSEKSAWMEAQEEAKTMTQQQETKPAPVTQVQQELKSGDAAAQLMAAIQLVAGQAKGPIDEETVRRIVQEEMEQSGGGACVRVQVGSLPEVKLDGLQHERYPYLLAVCAARIPCMLVGPAGSGKTSAAREVATAMGLAFYCQSVNPMTSKADLIGYRTPGTGEYVTTPFRDAWEQGGMYLLDEIDAGNAAVLTILNMALSGDVMTFGDGVQVKRHADFVPIAAANTFGTGADRQYVGRQQLDAATLDRFFMLEWGYDTAFEAALIGLPVKGRTMAKLAASGYTPETWMNRVHKIRAGVEKNKIRHVVGPRATFNGVRLLDTLPREILEEGCIWKGLPTIQREQASA